jgi:hypothetical protein
LPNLQLVAQAVEQVLPRLAVLRLAELLLAELLLAVLAHLKLVAHQAAALLLEAPRQVARVVLEHLKLVALQNNVNVRALA